MARFGAAVKLVPLERPMARMSVRSLDDGRRIIVRCRRRRNPTIHDCGASCGWLFSTSVEGREALGLLQTEPLDPGWRPNTLAH
jgi:hypothetical protein